MGEWTRVESQKGKKIISGPPAPAPQDHVLSTKDIYLTQRAGNKRQRQEIKNKGEEEGVWGGKGQLLDREETDMNRRQMAAYKDKGRNSMSG